MSQNEPAEPIAKGIIPTAKQSFGDLFRWKQRVAITNEHGETRYEWQSPPPLRNPFSLFAQLSARGWIFFLVGFAAWTADAFDFHALSIQTVKLAAYFKTSKTNVTTAITLTLLLRSIGAAFFGLAGDRFGRKWPMVINMLILGLLQVATIYCNTFTEFLAVRSLFGLFMGGVYGNAIAMALENCPVDARGLMSGILQQGYSFGYVLAACVNLGIGGSTDSWKLMFWIGFALSCAVGIIRILFPESRQFIEAKQAGKKHASAGAFFAETKKMLAKEWRMAVYCIILMTWFNYYSHTSQDSYTTFLLTEKEFNNDAASRGSILMKTGACVGGTIIGYLSQWVGRRRAMIGAALLSMVMIPAWIIPNSEGALAASSFILQFGVQGAWGTIPIHLNELAPPAFRSSFPGLTYQLGNMISSPSAQLVNAIAESNLIVSWKGHMVPAYGTTMGIATAIIATGIIVTAALGPEKRGSRFELAKVAGEMEMESSTKDVESDSIADNKHRASMKEIGTVGITELR